MRPSTGYVLENMHFSQKIMTTKNGDNFFYQRAQSTHPILKMNLTLTPKNGLGPTRLYEKFPEKKFQVTEL